MKVIAWCDHFILQKFKNEVLLPLAGRVVQLVQTIEFVTVNVFHVKHSCVVCYVYHAIVVAVYKGVVNSVWLQAIYPDILL